MCGHHQNIIPSYLYLGEGGLTPAHTSLWLHYILIEFSFYDDGFMTEIIGEAGARHFAGIILLKPLIIDK